MWKWSTTRRIAKVVHESPQVERFLHVSALGAAPNAPSKRLRTKVRFAREREAHGCS